MIEPSAAETTYADAVIEALLIDCIYQKEHATNPRKAIQDLITWNVQVALDPSVSSDARALIDKGQLMGNKQLLIGFPSMAIGLGIEDETKQKFIYLTKQKDGGDDLRKDSFKIKFHSKEDAITFRLALNELIKVWDKTEEELKEEIQVPKERTDLVAINEHLANIGKDNATV